MKIISSFFTTCLITVMISVILASILTLLHVDLIKENIDFWVVVAVAIACVLIIPFIYIFLFLPTYFFCKKEFAELSITIIYERYVFIIITPFAFLLSFVLFDSMINYYEARI